MEREREGKNSKNLRSAGNINEYELFARIAKFFTLPTHEKQIKVKRKMWRLLRGHAYVKPPGQQPEFGSH